MNSPRTTPAFATPPAITPEMIDAGTEQSRVDSSLSMTARDRVERMLRAAFTGQVDRALLDQSIRGL